MIILSIIQFFLYSLVLLLLTFLDSLSFLAFSCFLLFSDFVRVLLSILCSDYVHWSLVVILFVLNLL